MCTQYCNSCSRRRIKTEGKTKVVASLLGEEFIRYSDSMPNDINPNNIKLNDIKPNAMHIAECDIKLNDITPM